MSTQPVVEVAQISKRFKLFDEALAPRGRVAVTRGTTDASRLLGPARHQLHGTRRGSASASLAETARARAPCSRSSPGRHSRPPAPSRYAGACLRCWNWAPASAPISPVGKTCWSAPTSRLSPGLRRREAFGHRGLRRAWRALRPARTHLLLGHVRAARVLDVHVPGARRSSLWTKRYPSVMCSSSRSASMRCDACWRKAQRFFTSHTTCRRYRTSAIACCCWTVGAALPRRPR